MRQAPSRLAGLDFATGKHCHLVSISQAPSGQFDQLALIQESQQVTLNPFPTTVNQANDIQAFALAGFYQSVFEGKSARSRYLDRAAFRGRPQMDVQISKQIHQTTNPTPENEVGPNSTAASILLLALSKEKGEARRPPLFLLFTE